MKSGRLWRLALAVVTALLIATEAYSAQLLVEPYSAKAVSGRPYPGALLYTYEAGTTTPLATYSDYDLQTANANPIVADSVGLFGPVYGVASTAYKLVLKTSAGVTLWTRDNWYGAQDSSASLVTRVLQIATTPLDYGALGDGIADESSEVQSAIDNATGTVDLLGLTYRVDTALELTNAHNGITIKNGTLNFAQCADDYYLRLLGSLGTATVLTSSVAIGDTVIAVTSASGYVVGDIAYLTSSGVYLDVGDLVAGELVLIKSIAGLNITIAGGAQHAYTTVQGATMAEVTVVKDILLEDLTIIGAKSAAGTDVRAIHAQMVQRLTVRDVKIDSIEDFGFYLAGAVDTDIKGLLVRQGSGSAVGIVIDQSSVNTHMRHIDVSHLTAGLAIGYIAPPTGPTVTGTAGQVRDLYVDGFKGNSLATGINIRGNSYNVVVNDARMHGVASVLTGIGARWEVRGLRADDPAGTSSIALTPEVPNIARQFRLGLYDVHVAGKITINPGSIAAGSGDFERIVLSNVYAEGDVEILIDDDTDPDITNVEFSNVQTSGDCIFDIADALTSVVMTEATVKDSSCDSLTIDGDERITRLHVTNLDAAGIDIEDASYVYINGCHVDNVTATEGITITNPVGLHMTNCTVNAVNAVPSKGVYIHAASIAYDHISLTSNYIIANNADALTIDLTNAGASTGGSVTVTSNTVVGSGAGSKYVFNLDATTGGLERLTVTGNNFLRMNDIDSNMRIKRTGATVEGVIFNNTFENGTFGIEDETGHGTALRVDNNYYESIAVPYTYNIPYPDGLIFTDHATTPDTGDNYGAQADLSNAQFTLASDSLTTDDVIIVEFAVIAYNDDNGAPRTPTAWLQFGGVDIATLGCNALAVNNGCWLRGRAEIKIIDAALNAYVNTWSAGSGTAGSSSATKTAVAIDHATWTSFLDSTDSAAGGPEISVQGKWTVADVECTFLTTEFNIWHHRAERSY